MIEHEIATDRIITALADRIVADDDALTIDDLDALADLLTASALHRLCIAIDCCPFHHCDIEICNDDELDCSARIAAMTD